MTACTSRYTPDQAINAVWHHYIQLGGLPALSMDGRKLYHIDGNGCAITVLATPAMREMLALTDHHVSPACELSNQNINIAEIIDAPDWCRGRVLEFLQSIQSAHDAAGDEYRLNLLGGEPRGLCHDIFCTRLARELANVCREFDLTKLAQDLKLRDRPVRRDIPAKQIIDNAPRFDVQESEAPSELVGAL